MELRSKFESILTEHGIYGEDVENILDSVHEMLCYAADKLEKEEPHATISIKRLNDAAYEVFELSQSVWVV